MSQHRNAPLNANRRRLRRVSQSTKFERFLMDPGSMRAFFQKRLPVMYPGRHSVKRIAVSHQAALSTKSFLMRYRLDVVRPNGSIDRKNIRGNFVDPATYRIMQAVYTHRKPSFTSMRPLLFDARRRYEFYEEVPGVSLRNIPFRSAGFSRLIKLIARALADFHTVPIAKLRPLSWGAEKTSVDLGSARITRELPAYRRTITAYAAILLRAERRLWRANRSIVHNDFQASNVIVNGAKIGLIDFTLSAVGNAAIDIGNFLAHLTVMLHGVLSPSRIEQARRTFLDAYLSRIARIRRTAVRESIAVFELRSCIDILAITLINLGPKDKNRNAYCALLQRRITTLINEITRP